MGHDERSWALRKKAILTDVGIAAVENGLVATGGLADVSEGLDDAEPEFLSLLGFVDRDVLDVTDGAKSAEKLALDEKGADGDDRVRLDVKDDDRKVCVGCCAHGIELSDPRLLSGICHHGQYGKDGEVATVVVR